MSLHAQHILENRNRNILEVKVADLNCVVIYSDAASWTQQIVFLQSEGAEFKKHTHSYRSLCASFSLTSDVFCKKKNRGIALCNNLLI